MTSPGAPHRLLDALGSDRSAVVEACEPVQLVPGDTLARPGQPIDHVHFVETGFLSVLASEGDRDGVEVGLVGREGMAGISVALGCDGGPFRVLVQGAGTAYRMPSPAFRRACVDHPLLQRAALAYAQVFTTMVAETCRANARLTVEARLARWLLMAHDRLEGDELTVTHETLSKMLGVRRPGVTVALHMLEGEHMIRATRGSIRIVDRTKLSAAARGSYGRAEAEWLRIVPGTRAVAA